MLTLVTSPTRSGEHRMAALDALQALPDERSVATDPCAETAPAYCSDDSAHTTTSLQQAA